MATEIRMKQCRYTKDSKFYDVSVTAVVVDDGNGFSTFIRRWGKGDGVSLVGSVRSVDASNLDCNIKFDKECATRAKRHYSATGVVEKIVKLDEMSIDDARKEIHDFMRFDAAEVINGIGILLRDLPKSTSRGESVIPVNLLDEDFDKYKDNSKWGSW